MLTVTFFGPQISREGASQAQQRGLRGRVVMIWDHGVLKQVRTDVHDSSAAIAVKTIQCSLDHVQGTSHGTTELLVEPLEFDIFGLRTSIAIEREVHQGVVDHAGDRTPRRSFRLGEKPVHRRAVGHVRLDGPCLAWVGVGDGLGAFPASVVVDDDAASMGEHRFGDLFAKTTRSTRHQDKLLIDIHVQRIIAHDVALPPPM